MGKSLVIVESTAKAKTISKCLGRGFVVKAAPGPFWSWPKAGLGVDVAHDFRPAYETTESQKKVMAELKRAAKDVDNIYLAADPDGEGEAVCLHLQAELARKNGPGIYRVVLNELTASAVKKALEKPLTVNVNRAEAEQARRMMDRLVECRISSLLGGLVTGRVPAVALRLMVEREREIRGFAPAEYWTLDAGFQTGDGQLLMAAQKGLSAECANSCVAALAGVDGMVQMVDSSQEQRDPAPPFTTATLLEESARQLGFPAQRTMGLARHLYEGVELKGEGAVGLVTYIHTGSTRVASDAIAAVREWTGEHYGAAYRPGRPNVEHASTGGGEAIRPTLPLRAPETLAGQLDDVLLQIYTLIWKRFAGSQMTPSVSEQTIVEVGAQGRDGASYVFRAMGLVPKFEGFLAAAGGANGIAMPRVSAGDVLKLQVLRPQKHYTEPPPRFTEGALVRALAAAGLGRPATYAPILAKLREGGYIQEEGGQLWPTIYGTAMTDLLVQNFASLCDIQYAARLEAEFDEIETGTRDGRLVLADFYERFSGEFERAGGGRPHVAIPLDEACERCGKGLVLELGEQGALVACSGQPDCSYSRRAQPAGESVAREAGDFCENCGRAMVLKQGRFGQFHACSGYPECQTIRAGARPKPEVALAEKCPSCGAALVVKTGRFGEFTACSRYPACKHVRQKTAGMKCPACSTGDVIERRSQQGRTFYGCHRYPDCAFVAWGRPIAEKCPACSGPYLVEKLLKTGHWAQCPNRDCRWKRAIAAAEQLGGSA